MKGGILMDIYAYAESIGYGADYMDPHTGYIHGIQAYGRALKFGLPTPGILVYDSDGNAIGVARKN